MNPARCKLLSGVSALLFWLLPLGAFPLAFLRLTGNKVPLFGAANFINFPALGVISLAVIVWNFSRVKVLWQEFPAVRFTAVAGMLLMTAAVIQQFLYGGSIDHLGTALFYAATPVAAAAVAPELRRMMPVAAAVVTLLLLISGIQSENFTGLTGNWNWTQGLLLAFLPGIFLLFKTPHRRKMVLAAYALLVLGGAYFYPAELSRGVLGAVAGTFILFAVCKRIPAEWRPAVAAAVFTIGVAAVLAVGFFCDINDSRIQLFRGAVAMLNPHGGIGTGAERYFDFIPNFLPANYFLSPFSAPHHPHPHNELLYLFGSYGIAGVLFYGVLFTSVLTNLPQCRPQAYWFPFWVFSVIFFCGQLDMTAAIVPGAFWMLLSAGTALAPSARAMGRARPQLMQKAVFAVLPAVAVIVAGINFYSGLLYRDGRLAIHRDLPDQALQFYRRSIEVKPSKEALYGCAEILLHGKNLPAEALLFLEQLNDMGVYNYLHSNRMKAVCLVYARRFDEALAVLKQECINYPYSVINARLHLQLLQMLRRPAEEINAASAALETCCRLRGIMLPDAAKITMIDDDKPLVRPAERSIPALQLPGVTVEIIAAFALFFAALGAGGALLLRRRSAMIVEFGCGIIICAALGALLPGGTSTVLLLLLAPAGVWLNFEKIKMHWRLIAVFTFIMLLMAGNALLPPNSYDEQLYQIALLKRYCSGGFMQGITDNPYAAYPALHHAFLLTAFPWGGLTLPRLTILLFYAASGAYICKFLAARCGRFTAALIAGTILLSPLTLLMTRSFHTVPFILVFAIAAVVLLLKSAPDRWDIFLAGICAGGSAAVNPAGCGTVIALLSVLLFCIRSWKAPLLFLAGVLVCAAPYYLRIWYFYGNPFYPAGSALWGGSEAAVLVEHFHAWKNSSAGAARGWKTMLSGWLFTAFKPQLYHGISSGFQFPLLFISALACAFTASAVDKGRQRLWLGCGSALAVTYILWSLLIPHTRHLFLLLVAAAVLAVVAAALVFPGYIKWSLALCAFIAAVITLMSQSGFIMHYYFCYRVLQEARQHPAGFATARDSGYIQLANQVAALPQNVKIASLFELRTLYFARPVTILTPHFQERLTPVPQTPEELLEILREFDYIIVRMPDHDIDRMSPEADAAVDLIWDHLEILQQQEKLLPLPDGQDMILRVAVTAAGDAADNNVSNSDSRVNLDASFLKEAGNPRPRR